MIDYGLKDKVVLITGTNNPQGIGATTALAFAREGAKVVMVYKRVFRPFDPDETAHNGVDRYYHANAGGTDEVEAELKKLGADYLVMESDIADEAAVEAIYTAAMERYGKVDILPYRSIAAV
jgi:3-oxoacyl-[acyl-carrier protein] reductase